MVSMATVSIIIIVKGAMMVGGDVEAHSAQDQSVVKSCAAAFQAHWKVFEYRHDGAGGRGTGVEEPEGGEGDKSNNQ